MQGGRSVGLRGRRAALAAGAVAVLTAPLLLAQAPPAPAGTMDRIRAAGTIRLGYRADARPFAYKDESGQPAGYSVALCRSLVDAAKREPGLAGLRVEWVPIAVEERFTAVQQGRIDVLCGAETVTLARRALVSFSLPIFPGGVAAAVRADAPARLRQVLAGRGQTYHPVWRASASSVLQARAFSAVQGTTADTWLTGRIRDLQVIADVTRVSGYDAGIQALVDRRSDAFFGERAVLLDAVKRHPAAAELAVIDRQFTYEPIALAFARGDEEFRLVVDRALSRLYSSGQLGTLYAQTFGEPDESTLAFFRWTALPD
jgi:ABC-type amino acid transport substrate-binding protein